MSDIILLLIQARLLKIRNFIALIFPKCMSKKQDFE